VHPLFVVDLQHVPAATTTSPQSGIKFCSQNLATKTKHDVFSTTRRNCATI
jgi:hypothetical protein